MAKKFKTMDGNNAAAYVSYAFTEVAAIYPITPSSTMAEVVDEMSARGEKNIFGQTVDVVEMQSEAGAAGAVHGSLQAGALTTTFTASQGLLLMIPNMYKIAGELLPTVFHVSARALAAHALNIFGDHQDVMACRQTGFAMLASGSVQEVMDLGGVAHLASIKSRVPFLHFFDGFRTSHEIQKIEVMDYEDLKGLIDYDALKAFKDNALNPEHPVLRGTAQNSDIYFQGREASNKFYDAVPDVVADYMKEISKITGREYAPFTYYGAKDATKVIVAMGSVCEAIEETIDYLNAAGEKVGVVKVHLYRPFSSKYFFDVLPETVEKIAVLDRTKEPGSLGEPLYLDVCNLFYGKASAPVIVGGRYGLGSKDTTPTQIVAVFNNLDAAQPKNGFTIGIVDDVTNLSLELPAKVNAAPAGTTRCKFWGFGSDGTVGANKDAIKIIGDNTDLYAQAYFDYDSKKSGGVTMSHLRFGKKPIKSTYLLDEADYIACHKPAYLHQYDILEGLKKGGTFLLNCVWTPEELDEKLPANVKRYLAENEIEFYTINAVDVAVKVGLGPNRINMVTQSAFFKLANVIDFEEAVVLIKNAIKKTYGKKGDEIVNMNCAAVDGAIEALKKIDVPASWKDAKDEAKDDSARPAFIKNIVDPVNAQRGNKLPVSTFVGIEDGTFETGTSAYEKRGVAVNVPTWIADKCIQCNQCSLVCPHAAIRPVLLTDEEAAGKPAGFDTLKATGFEGKQYRMQVSVLDCLGCGVCAQVCPKAAIEMNPIDSQYEQVPNWNYAMTVPSKQDEIDISKNIKNSQFAQPMLEFSGACAGCGETPYIKLITQLFGDRMMVANATGCTSIWGGSAPSMPYTKNAEGKGPAWANSLFEDNAEFGLGMVKANQKIRNTLKMRMESVMDVVKSELAEAFKAWIAGMDDAAASKAAAKDIAALIGAEDMTNPAIKEIADRTDFLVKRSQWVFGGDGWAYDIGYGGLDHVIASGEDINIFVVDTEVYSNTGGQSSKATPTGAVAKFAASGKKVKKKDLGMIGTTYGYVYVAQIALGANPAQALKAIREAEAYNGPSLIIAYAPCINHGIKAKGNMANSIAEEKKAVETGYWHLWRYDPTLAEAGQNPFQLDSKEPTGKVIDFLMGENRYLMLQKAYPDIAGEIFAKAEKDLLERYENYKRMAKAYND